MKKTINLKRDGFSLVEVSLALLVVSIGLLSLVGLFPASLDMSKRAIDETYATFLADSAFTSYKEVALSTNMPWNSVVTYQSIGPNTISQGKDVFWKNSDSLKLRANPAPGGPIQTLVFTAGSTAEKWMDGAGWVLPSSWSMMDHALRYRLTIQDAGASDPRIKKVTMEVWMGEYGNAANQKPEVFYTEIFRHEP